MTEQNERAIFLYIKNKIKEGQKFFKSHYIGKDMDLSAKFVGSVLYKFMQEKRLKITKYAEASSRITWQIEEESK